MMWVRLSLVLLAAIATVAFVAAWPAGAGARRAEAATPIADASCASQACMLAAAAQNPAAAGMLARPDIGQLFMRGGR